uniref:Uncharacterized protein n=1 Tax=Arcella intermedia TaxID=1963864 RepID=A0A6B2L8H9_9EUKA
MNPCCAKRSPEEEAQYKRNKLIEKQLKPSTDRLHLVLLLLGTGDAGKSTFAKQMVVLHKDGFSRAELEQFVEVLHENCLSAIRVLIEACRRWHIPMAKKYKPHTELLMRVDIALTEDVAESVQLVWETDGIQLAFTRSNEIQLPGGESGTSYYIQNCHRFAKKDFLPTQEDVIRAKCHTTEIKETDFAIGKTEFKMVDVGGQRSERRKWLHCFSDVSAVIYLAALNEYDMVLEEDGKTNRMQESLSLFQKLSDQPSFKSTAFILFLNKSDIFKEKIAKKPLSEFFEDYDAFVGKLDASQKGSDWEQGAAYIKSLYCMSFSGERLYTFVTCAIDTANCDRVFGSVRDTVVSHVLTVAGF